MKDSTGFDVEILADKTIEMLSVSPGQVIWIWANNYSMDFIEALAYRIRARGAFWLLRLTTEPLLRRIGLDVPEQYLSLIPDHEVRWLMWLRSSKSVTTHPPSRTFPRRAGAPWGRSGLR
jgi:hypothetical protein